MAAAQRYPTINIMAVAQGYPTTNVLVAEQPHPHEKRKHCYIELGDGKKCNSFSYHKTGLCRTHEKHRKAMEKTADKLTMMVTNDNVAITSKTALLNSPQQQHLTNATDFSESLLINSRKYFISKIHVVNDCCVDDCGVNEGGVDEGCVDDCGINESSVNKQDDSWNFRLTVVVNGEILRPDDIKLKSEAIKNFLQDHKDPKLIDYVKDVFDYLFMHPSHHPYVPGPGICLAVDAPYAKNPTLDILRHAYLCQNFGEDTKARKHKSDKRKCFRATYATACGIGTSGTPPSQFAVRSFTESMRAIGKAIEEFLCSHYKGDSTVEVHPINNCVLLTYLEGMGPGEHRDICHTINGQYDATKKSQKEKTVTAILVIGDTCRLKFHLYGYRGQKMEKIDEEEDKHFFDQVHGTLFLLHPEDERPFIRAWYAEYNKTFFKHSCDGVGKGKNGCMSLGISMCVVCHTHEVISDRGRLVLRKENQNDEREIHRQCDTILQLYLCNPEQKEKDEKEMMNNWKNINKYYF